MSERAEERECGGERERERERRERERERESQERAEKRGTDLIPLVSNSCSFSDKSIKGFTFAYLSTSSVKWCIEKL